MKEIVISTDNVDKLQEIKEILADFSLEILSKKDVGLGDLEVIEDQDTLKGNALLKARAIYKRVHKSVLADDTGLFVEALNGAPGVYSARYAGEDCSYKDNREKLLADLKGVPREKRGAYFETCIVYIDERGEEHSVHGRVKGFILTEERGTGGFGYDAVFMPEGETRSFSEMREKEKNAISHRKRALEAFVKFYRKTQV